MHTVIGKYFTMALVFSSIFILSISFASPPHLLSLKCTPSPSNQTYHHPMTTIVDKLMSKAPESQLTTLNVTFGRKQYRGLLQCRTGLSPKECALCAKTARNTILSLCRNSSAVSSWFDGCYVQILPTTIFRSSYVNISNHSCSGRAINQDPARIAPAIGALLLKLRADVNIATHHGFSDGEIAYESIYPNESKIYGLVECVRSLSPEECDSCVDKAVEKLEFYCVGKSRGFAVYGPCLVRFDDIQFYDGGGVLSSYAGVGVSDNFTVLEGENEYYKNGGCKKKLLMAYWGGGVACFVVFVLLVCLLRTSVLNKAKVGTL